MKSNKELRQETKAAIRGRWFWRIALVAFTLQTIAQFVAQLLARFNQQRGIMSANEFWMRKIAAIRQGLDFALPTHDAYTQMCVATGFEYFISLLFGAIVLFGITAVTLRAVSNRDEKWFSSGFGGFRRPLGITALLFVQNVIVGFWAMFFIVPGVIMAYRYRAVWYLKCENPDWGIRQCLGESAKMMKGYKWKAFFFDLHYIGLLFVIALLGSVGVTTIWKGSTVAIAVGSMISSCAVVAALYVMILFVAGRTVFYRALKAVQKPEVKDDLA